ncbi:hypothetical protein ATG_07910 [Desulfurococcaceae archaeon AG1]|nr:hypothetical protein ATG_07910 [Desulfurococcaceae archaeon AG1]
MVTRDPETWYALTNLSDELGYELIESSKDPEGRYLVRIRIRMKTTNHDLGGPTSTGRSFLEEYS